MYRTQKSATCCYCGTKSVLTLDGARHELKCSACGAPLSKMKVLKTAHVEDAYTVGKTAKQKKPKSFPKKTKHKKKKKKSFAYHLFDAAEDLFDIFD